jgi:hypothetical protein
MELAVTTGLPKPVYCIGIEEKSTSLHTIVAILKDNDFGLLSENCLKKATLESFWILHYFWGQLSKHCWSVAFRSTGRLLSSDSFNR